MSIDWAHAATGGPLLSDRSAVQSAIASVPFWWHSIELAPGVVTPGQQSESYFASQWESFGLGDLRGQTVLDIGAWDGYYSFAAERRGADRVLALDRPIWEVDRADPALSRSPELPGKRGFDVARSALQSGVQECVADLADVDPGALGTFDVVLFLGVLYHLQDPLGGLRRVAALTERVAVIETEVMVAPGYDRSPLWRFYGDDSLNGDPTNWWVPNEAAVHELGAAAGFARVETIVRARPLQAVPGELLALGRLTCRAYVR